MSDQITSPETKTAEDNIQQETGTQEPTPKTYTQEEVDKLIGIQKAKLPKKEELEAFNAWKAEEAKKKEAEKPKDENYLQLEAQNKQLQAQISQFENREKVLKAGVSPSFAEYVAFTVAGQVTEDTDFDTALSTWLEANQHYKAEEAPPKATGMRHGNPLPQKNGVEEEFLRRNPGLKLD